MKKGLFSSIFGKPPKKPDEEVKASPVNQQTSSASAEKSASAAASSEFVRKLLEFVQSHGRCSVLSLNHPLIAHDLHAGTLKLTLTPSCLVLLEHNKRAASDPGTFLRMPKCALVFLFGRCVC